MKLLVSVVLLAFVDFFFVGFVKLPVCVAVSVVLLALRVSPPSPLPWIMGAINIAKKKKVLLRIFKEEEKRMYLRPHRYYSQSWIDMVLISSENITDLQLPNDVE